jgi:hypothetical protein
MNIPDNLPLEKRPLLVHLVESLAGIPRVAAVVLGGSYASGMQTGASDLDIGIYYTEADPFPLEQIRRIAKEISRPGQPPTVTGFYEWGAWVNGGAWIQTAAGKVDFLYRNLDQVQKAIQDAQAGIYQHDYDQQPSNGFYSLGYLAETRICLPLYDPHGRIAELKTQVQGYPPKLKQKIIAGSIWGTEFTLIHARGFAGKADIYNTAGCLVRAAAYLTQALFAFNERYFLGDKRVLETLAGFAQIPIDYTKHISSILACPGASTAELSASVAGMEALWKSVAALVG